ncbi:MAG TPA: hypothetical protein VGJ13_16880 [Pseudonocardiaceae bacterium]|jgi:hypothetical protein
MLHVSSPAGAVIPATPKLRIKRVEDLRIQRSDLHLTDQGTDVLAHITSVQLQSSGRPVELIQVSVEPLADRGRGTRIAPLLDLTDEPIPGCTSFALRLRPGWDDFDEVVSALGHRVDPGVHTTLNAPLGSSSMLPRSRRGRPPV